MSCLWLVQEDPISFNKNVLRDIFRRKRLLEARIARIQRSMEMVDSVNLVRLERELQEEYHQTLGQEEILWFQKSREQWVRFGIETLLFSMPKH